MKYHRLAYILIFSGVLLITFGIVLGSSVVSKLQSSGSTYATGKITISIKKPSEKHSKANFTLDEIHKLGKKLNTSEYSCLSVTSSTAAFEDRTARVNVNGVSYPHDRFYDINLKRGGFLTDKSCNEKALVAIIDSELANELFMTDDVVGKNFSLFGRTFKIVGVFSMDKSIIHTFTDSGIPDIFIPVDTLLELDKNASIAGIQIKTGDTGTSGRNEDELSNAIMALGKNPSDYKITDYNLLRVLLSQRPLFIVFAAGLLSILALLLHMKNRIISAYKLIKDVCRQDYFFDIIRRIGKVKSASCLAGKIAVLSAEISVIAISVIVLWRCIAFRLYIPPEYIPDELIDLSYYINLIKGNLSDGISGIGYIPPSYELMLNTACSMANVLFFTGLFGGGLLVFLGLQVFRGYPVQSLMIIVFSSVSVVLCTMAAAAASTALGFPPTLQLKSILPVYGFILIYTNLFTNERKVVSNG